MPHTCWSCEENFKNGGDLRNHYMRRPHRFLEVVCAWCMERKEQFRRPVDLRQHIGDHHKALKKEHGKEFPTDSEAFFLATKPRAYLNSLSKDVSRTPRTAILREAILNNKVLGSLDTWQKGWDRHGPLTTTVPYSPTKPALWSLEGISLDPEGGKLVVAGGLGDCFRITVGCDEAKSRERVLRRMASLKSRTCIAIPDYWMVTTDTSPEKILTSIGLQGLPVIRIEKNAYANEEVPVSKSKRPRYELPPSPITPLTTPPNEPMIEAPESSPTHSELESSKDLPPAVSDIPTALNDLPYLFNDLPSASGDGLSASIDLPPAAGDNPSQEPELPCASTCPSSDVPSTEEPDELSRRAVHLLLAGGMPLFPPARRNWTQESTLQIPLEGFLQTWPPLGWQKMSPDTRLLLWEALSTNLALLWNLPLERSTLLDSFQFLALPGSKESTCVGVEGRMRHANYTILRKIALGQEVTGKATIIDMLEAAFMSSSSCMSGGYRDLLVAAAATPLRL